VSQKLNKKPVSYIICHLYFFYPLVYAFHVTCPYILLVHLIKFEKYQRKYNAQAVSCLSHVSERKNGRGKKKVMFLDPVSVFFNPQNHEFYEENPSG